MTTSSPQSLLTTTIIISILGSSLLTACFTKIADYYFNKINYKKDYLKIILEKRLSSYEKLLDLLFHSGTIIEDKDKRCYSVEFESAHNIIKYLDDMIALQAQ